MFTQVQTLSGVFVLTSQGYEYPFGPNSAVVYFLVGLLYTICGIGLHSLERYCLERNAALAQRLGGLANPWVRFRIYLIDGLIALGESLVHGAFIGGFFLGSIVGGSQWFFLVTLIVYPFVLFAVILARRKLPAPDDDFILIHPGPVIEDEKWTLARLEPIPPKPSAAGGPGSEGESVNPYLDWQPYRPDSPDTVVPNSP